MKKRNFLGGRDGFAIVLVLWVIGACGLLSLSLAEQSHLEAHLSRNFQDQIRARLLSQSSVDLVVAKLIAARRGNGVIDSPALNEVTPNGAIFTGEFNHEGGKLNLNGLDGTLAANAFRLAGMDQPDAYDLANLIMHHSDNRRAGDGGEGNGSLQSVRQLLPLSSLKHESLLPILSLVSVHKMGTSIDADSAPRPLRLALSSDTMNENTDTRPSRRLSTGRESGQLYTVTGTAQTREGVVSVTERVIWFKSNDSRRFRIVEDRSRFAQSVRGY